MALVTKDFSGTWGADISWPLSPDKLQQIISTPLPNGQCIEFIIRYVFFRYPSPASDLTKAEALAIWACRSLKGNPIGLGVVVHPRLPRFNSVNADLGAADMDAAIKACVDAGYDPAVIRPDAGPPVISPDIEGVLSDGPSSAAYLNAAHARIVAANARPGSYMGYQTKLTAADLAAAPGNPLWWADFQLLANHPQPPNGKWALHQHPQISHCGVPTDLDEAPVGGGWVCVIDNGEDPLPANPIQTDTKAVT